MSFRYKEIADRLRAYRMGSGLSADEVARRLGISRTALYRFEKGELAKIETLEKLSELLGVSMPTLLGVGIEYMPSAVTYFERMRQLEENAEHIIILAGPISFLLASDAFADLLGTQLLESVPPDLPSRDHALAQVQAVIEVLAQRRARYLDRRPGILNLVSARDLARLVASGFVGNTAIQGAELARRRELARAEILHLVDLIECEPIGVQIGVVTETLPHTGFQIFKLADRHVLTISPFRLGEQTNVRLGVAMLTSAPDAITMHKRVIDEMWRGALKGASAAAALRTVLDAAPSRGA
jgi:transcriptional regulator with XRE-family HTH domain